MDCRAQKWNPADYSENARFVSDLGMPVLEWLVPEAGESILDLGCGDGVLTLKLAGLGCHVIGVDASPEMIAGAQALGLQASVCDGHKLTFSSEFDAVFSNAALHWMTQPEAVIEGVMLPESQHQDFIAAVVNELKSDLCDGAGNWHADYVRLRFLAIKLGFGS